MSTLFALIAAIPILDKWFGQLSKLYRGWKYERDQLALAQALNKADQEQETEDLQDQIGRHEN